MMHHLTLDNIPFQFDESFLPCIIVGRDGSGASYLSINLVANLINSHSKVIFFSAFPMAKEELLSQVESDRFFEITEQGDLMEIPPEKSIIIKSGDQFLLLETIKKIKDRGEYIIFIKNFEKYNNILGDILKEKSKVILSGNLDECIDKKNLLNTDWQSKIIFQPQNIDFGIKIPDLKKYESYLMTKTKIDGVLRLL